MLAAVHGQAWAEGASHLRLLGVGVSVYCSSPESAIDGSKASRTQSERFTARSLT